MVASEGQLSLHIQERRALILTSRARMLMNGQGRDETSLCSLSNFDAYYITRPHRAPKAFTFTIKSTDNLSFFENAADYMHTFSCSEKNGEAWMEKILFARVCLPTYDYAFRDIKFFLQSYVLRQERSVLFQPKTLNNASNTGAAISRSGTKKATVTKPHQPLVNLSPGDIFEPGSLLSKQ